MRYGPDVDETRPPCEAGHIGTAILWFWFGCVGLGDHDNAVVGSTTVQVKDLRRLTEACACVFMFIKAPSWTARWCYDVNTTIFY